MRCENIWFGHVLRNTVDFWLSVAMRLEMIIATSHQMSIGFGSGYRLWFAPCAHKITTIKTLTCSAVGGFDDQSLYDHRMLEASMPCAVKTYDLDMYYETQWMSGFLLRCLSSVHPTTTTTTPITKKHMTPSMLDVGDDQSLYDHRMVEAIMTCTAKYKNEVSVGMRPM
jgi:hypothetical protein